MADLKLMKIIKKKRDGEALLAEDIEYFINSVVNSSGVQEEKSEVADRCQIGAMLMAMYLKGLNEFETAVLTEKMKNSGYVFKWPGAWSSLVVDKHSTGGVGDKVSLILAPTLAALGLKVPMISGRSLAHTGGTLDKLESIPGYKVELDPAEIHYIMETVGCCIVGQTSECVPADKVLYQSREITATVDCPPLIVASIVSKKLSESPHVLVYDVKFGRGSIFKSEEEALETAKQLVSASRSVKAVAILTSMENPLGKTIGNSLEVIEAIKTLKGEGPSDVVKLVTCLALEILSQVPEKKEHGIFVEDVLSNGCALLKFCEMMIRQGVDVKLADKLCYSDENDVLPKAPYQTEIVYTGSEGYISAIDPLTLGNIWKKELHLSGNNPGVGFELLKVVGQAIKPGDIWLRMHHHQIQIPSETMNDLKSSLTVCPERKRCSIIKKAVMIKDGTVVVQDYPPWFNLH